MILYMSYATEYNFFNKLLGKGKVYPSNQMEKFNSSLIKGLASYDDVVSLSALPYRKSAKKSVIKLDNIQYICIPNISGRFHKFFNVIGLMFFGMFTIIRKHPNYIICDAINNSPCYVSSTLAKLFRIPAVAIVTDLPGMLGINRNPYKGIKRIQRFDGYILLTEAMRQIVNPQNKPYMIMEGLCSPIIPKVSSDSSSKKSKRIILYTGALWKHDAGIEYFVEGFLKAGLENTELHFYGVGELVEWLKSIEQKHPNVKYKGVLPNDKIIEKQLGASLLINPRPSDEEFCIYSFPSKTIEYMLSGTPVLMTRLPGVPAEYFDYVYTINQETSDGVCTVLKEIFSRDSNYMRDLGKKAREFVINNKSYEKQAKRVYDFCKSITR